MNLQQMYYFQAISRLKNYTKAAEQLLVAQSSLSHSIGDLERELGVPLFFKVGRNIDITEYGKQFLIHVDRITAELELANQELKNMLNPNMGKIRIALAYTVSNRFIPNMIKGFYENEDNRAIQFEAAWGRTLAYTQYKALKHGKLVVTVPAAYSSQQCPKCGHTHRSNRPDQAHFACTNPDCRFNEDHQLTADQVAAMNIAARAVKQIFDDQQKSKERKRLLRMRKKGESKGQGRGGTPRTVMRSGDVGAAKPVEPMPDTGNLPVSTLAVKPESLDKRVALAGECSSTSL